MVNNTDEIIPWILCQPDPVEYAHWLLHTPLPDLILSNLIDQCIDKLLLTLNNTSDFAKVAVALYENADKLKDNALASNLRAQLIQNIISSNMMKNNENYIDLMLAGLSPSLAGCLAIPQAPMQNDFIEVYRSKIKFKDSDQLFKTSIVDKLILDTTVYDRSNIYNHGLFTILKFPLLSSQSSAELYAEYAKRIDHIPEFIAKKLRSDEYGPLLRNFHGLLPFEKFEYILNSILTPPTFAKLKDSLTETRDPRYLADLMYSHYDTTRKSKKELIPIIQSMEMRILEHPRKTDANSLSNCKWFLSMNFRLKYIENQIASMSDNFINLYRELLTMLLTPKSVGNYLTKHQFALELVNHLSLFVGKVKDWDEIENLVRFLEDHYEITIIRHSMLGIANRWANSSYLEDTTNKVMFLEYQRRSGRCYKNTFKCSGIPKTCTIVNLYFKTSKEISRLKLALSSI